MKKSELRQLIREEISKVLNEPKSNIELKGPDMDELIDAINFINTGVKTNKGLQPHSGIETTLKALDEEPKVSNDGFSIGVKPTNKVSNESQYIEQVNDLLKAHGFECELIISNS